MTTKIDPIEANPILFEMRSAVETSLKESVNRSFAADYLPMRQMLEHHFGWLDNLSSGKRIRPLLLLLVAEAAGTPWMKALPAAVAIELIHNFSLIHDDIQDHSEIRHNRPTLWVRNGIAQAINAGDALFTIGLQKIWELSSDFPIELVKRVYLILNHTCLRLTQGQYLDLDFEQRDLVSTGEYLEMINGKTNALITTTTQIGALLGGADSQKEVQFSGYGHNLGLAFQIMDDYLGIWGESASTGKSTSTDLTSHKKTYPILIGLENDNPFKQRWLSGPIAVEETGAVAKLLQDTGAKEKTLDYANTLTNQALTDLTLACGDANPVLSTLSALTEWLIKRSS